MYDLTRRHVLMWIAAALGSLLPATATAANSPSPTKRYTEQGYDYDETSAEWKELCVALPCFAALWWPDYSTKVIEDKIDVDGKPIPIVIQLWKGFCPQFLNSANMPGGVGGEVGIYRRVPGRPFPSHSSVNFLPLAIYEALKAKAGNDLWWPVPELKTRVDFELINSKVNKPFIKAPQQTTYWRNKWMQNASYKKYQAAAKETPAHSWDYAMKFTVNGKTYPVWRDHK